jgi:formylglycine-generating enzyme required for sulfatase activity
MVAKVLLALISILLATLPAVAATSQTHDSQRVIARADSDATDPKADPEVQIGYPNQDAAGTLFRECSNCPEMVVVPAGSYDSAVDEPRIMAVITRLIPQSRHIDIAKPFAVGVYDVTREEYSVFVRETGWAASGGCQFWDGRRWVNDERKDWRSPGFTQSRRDPAVCISWNDAQAYVCWLNSKTSSDGRLHDVRTGPYRLMSDEEWEYAARGGMSTAKPYYWGDAVSHDVANYGLDQCFPCGVKKEGRDRWYYTSPVGSFPPNAFGIYDAFGNVWQWVDDCYHDQTSSLSPDTASRSPRDCGSRTLRGGSWLDAAQFLKIAAPIHFGIQIENNANGFRVARDLD